MNFLAHLYLSPPVPAAWIGNLLPDLVRGRRRTEWEAMQTHPSGRLLVKGMRNHRRVDAFTDTHPLFARSRARVQAAHGRFSGIVVDMLYDHFLARDWGHYHPEPLPDFAAKVYAGFASHTKLMPEPMPEIVDVMERQNWLCCYADPAGLALTLRRMSRRFSERFDRDIDLEPAAEFAHDEGLAADFHAFFPQLIRYVGIPDPRRAAAAAGLLSGNSADRDNATILEFEPTTEATATPGRAAGHCPARGCAAAG